MVFYHVKIQIVHLPQNVFVNFEIHIVDMLYALINSIIKVLGGGSGESRNKM